MGVNLSILLHTICTAYSVSFLIFSQVRLTLMVGSGTLQLRPLLTLFARNHNQVHKPNMTIICGSLLSPALVFVNLIGQKRGEEEPGGGAGPSPAGPGPPQRSQPHANVIIIV